MSFRKDVVIFRVELVKNGFKVSVTKDAADPPHQSKYVGEWISKTSSGTAKLMRGMIEDLSEGTDG